MTFDVITLGCRVNQYESDYIISQLLSRGHTRASDNADIYVINTCTVTAESDRKSRQLIRRCISKSPNAIVIVTGCYSQINQNEALNIDGVSFVCGNGCKSKIPEIIDRLLSGTYNERSLFCDLQSGEFDYTEAGAPTKRTRAFVKIQDGCDSKCAYCIIPSARGSVRSSNPQAVLSEIQKIADDGCVEVVLTGIETASYGKDFKNGYTLGDLLTQVDKIDGIERIRLGSLDPSQITRDFVDKIKGLKKIMPHFHISLQSGCTKTLNAMKRKYSAEMARENIAYLRSAFPKAMLSADIITGFPGESDEDFAKTYDFLKEIEFLHLHVFPYSKRKGTVAEKMPNQVPENVKKERLYALYRLEKDTQGRIFSKICEKSTELSVLFEVQKDGFLFGHSSDFIPVKLPATEPCLLRKCASVRAVSFDDDGIIAELI